ncbi:MAG: alpha/beta fold hydrolase [Hyphomicrobium sp.]|nr:alpha/beta fold hydrolase [Hyphomicrobium sp.]
MPIGPRNAGRHLLLAHGAGASTASPFLVALAQALADQGITVWPFDFAYMRSARTTGKRRPPPKIPLLEVEYRVALEVVRQVIPPDAILVAGGKSMGGRIATLVAADASHDGLIHGVVAFGYPFHRPGKPETARTAHLAALATPLLIVQGSRDPFGDRDDVAGYTLSPGITMSWIEGGDHDLGWRPGRPLTIFDTVARNVTTFIDAIPAT